MHFAILRIILVLSAGREGVRLSGPSRIAHGCLPLAALLGASAAVRWRTQFRLPPLLPDFKYGDKERFLFILK